MELHFLQEKDQTTSKDTDNLSCAPRIIFALVLGSVITLAAFPLQAMEKMTIGLVPEINIFAQMKRFQPLADHLSRQTGTDIRLSMISGYGSIVERLGSHEIDAAFLGSFTAALAISQLNAIPVARPLNLDNTSTYYGYLFARKDSNIKKIEDMRDKTMVFVAQETTAGFLFPVAWLRQEGVADHTKFFSDFFFAGSHDAAIDAVLNGRADIGAAKNTIYEYSLAGNPRIQDELFIVARSEPVPSNGLCVMPTVGREAIAKLQTALLELDKTAEGRKVLQNLHARKFIETNPADYDPVFDFIKKAGITIEPYRSYAQ